MKIQLVQSEIELAISNYIRETITVNDGMSITMELRATRGAEGFQADIDISRTTDVAVAATPAKQSTASVAITRTVGRPPAVGQGTIAQNTAAAPENTTAEVAGTMDKAAAEVEAQQETNQEANLPGTDTVESPVEASPVKRSLFAGLKKPVNPA